MTDGAKSAEEIIFLHALIADYCIVASTALLWFDYALTFAREYRRIWKRQVTGATVIYLIMRYSAMVRRVVYLLEVFVWRSSDQERCQACSTIVHTDNVLLIINDLATSALISLRVYSVWGRDWRPLLIAVPVSSANAFILIYENWHYTPLQAGRPFGCIYIWALPANTLSSGEMTFDIVLSSMQDGFRTPLATLLLRDGTVYFLILLTVQLSWLILVLTESSASTWSLVSLYFGQVLVVILHSRFMLDLRGLYFATDDRRQNRSARSEKKATDFSASVIGNLGATVMSHSSGGSGPLREMEEGTSGANSSPFVDAHEPGEEDAPEYSENPFFVGMTSR
ncbi:hypothetical protein C8Q77DRAFT_1161150 [Trametes polyzona]|nr:hypothetical protein C8Q77DRAFT_1161150 [Trametes polyzona]